MVPFQCDTCHVRNILGRDPLPEKVEDVRLMMYIRRANLDAMWGRESSTVKKNLEEAKRAVHIAGMLGISAPFRPMGPFPLEDGFGMGAAVIMLQRSLDQGMHARHIQFGTLRKMRSMFSNVYHASAQSDKGMVMAKDTRKLTVTDCPTYGEWFERFIRGVHKRMGDITKPDRALSLDALLEIMKALEAEWMSATSSDKLPLALEGAFYLIAYCGGLRGEEVPMVDLGGIIKYWDEGGLHRKPHVVIPLLGRFKNEVGERYHLLPMSAKTPRGLELRKWVGRVVREYQIRGIVHGPMFRNDAGEPIKAGVMEGGFMRRLEDVQDEFPSLVGSGVVVSEEYGIYRSFRRGATSEATNKGLPADVIDANNRWRKIDRAGASQASLPMRDHYTDVRLILDKLLRFSEAL